MPSILQDVGGPAKILLVGKSGAGKTGSLASLVAAGYNLRIIDTDKGVRRLRTLLTDGRYPYRALIERQKIDLNHAVRYVPIDISMKMRTISRKIGDKTTSESLLAPTDGKAWPRVMTLLDTWKEDDGFELGSVSTWTTSDVLVLDSLSTLAKCAYYFNQSLNGRLGARDEGYDYQRDIGGAQSQLTRLLELLYGSHLQCNVIVISHITWVDESQGVASRPKETNNEGGLVISNPDGYPSAIGRALSPQIGKYFNDSYIVRADGTGAGVRRTISTVPQDGVIAKNSVYLERDYPISHGLATIFSALRDQPLPPGFPEAFASAPRTAAPTANSTIAPKPAVKSAQPTPATALTPSPAGSTLT